MNALLPGSLSESAEFTTAWTKCLAGVGQRRRAGLFRHLQRTDQSWKKAYQKVHAVIGRYVMQALQETELDAVVNVEKRPLILKSHPNGDTAPQQYVLLYEMAKQVRDPVELRYQMISVFLPARDTTSIFVGNALFHLARHPEIWTDLRTDALKLGTKRLSFEVLKSLPLFRYVLFETVRVTGPSGRVLRTALRNTMLPQGGGADDCSPVFVAKGTQVAMNLWALHHDKDIWGDDVNEFRPQRWVDKRPMWDFVPFLGGPRICPAQQQVMIQTTYLLVRLAKEFERIENRDRVLEYVELTKMTTESRNGVKVVFLPATQQKDTA